MYSAAVCPALSAQSLRIVTQGGAAGAFAHEARRLTCAWDRS